MLGRECFFSSFDKELRLLWRRREREKEETEIFHNPVKQNPLRLSTHAALHSQLIMLCSSFSFMKLLC